MVFIGINFSMPSEFKAIGFSEIMLEPIDRPWIMCSSWRKFGLQTTT